MDEGLYKGMTPASNLLSGRESLRVFGFTHSTSAFCCSFIRRLAWRFAAPRLDRIKNNIRHHDTGVNNSQVIVHHTNLPVAARLTTPWHGAYLSDMISAIEHDKPLAVMLP